MEKVTRRWGCYKTETYRRCVIYFLFFLNSCAYPFVCVLPPRDTTGCTLALTDEKEHIEKSIGTPCHCTFRNSKQNTISSCCTLGGCNNSYCSTTTFCKIFFRLKRRGLSQLVIDYFIWQTEGVCRNIFDHMMYLGILLNVTLSREFCLMMWFVIVYKQQ